MGPVMSTIPKPATKPDLLREAEEYLTAGHYHSAITAYTCCLEEMGLYDIDTLANRSLACLRAGVYSLALLDSEVILQVGSHSTAIVCKIHSLWGLRKYEEAINFIGTKLPKALRELPLYKDLEIKAHKILKQSKGEYDMCEIIKLPTNQCQNIGEYEGPIEVLDIPGKGRGVFATADLSPGQLLIACSSFAFAVRVEDQLHTERSAILTRQIISKLIHKDEFVRDEFRKGAVSGGQDFSALTNVQDFSALIQAMFFSDKSAELRLHYQQIDDCVNNYMLINFGKNSTSFGIWPSASNFRNDCVDANAHIRIFGNVCIIRALNLIQKGQEITVNRLPSKTLEYRKLFMKGEEGECKCRLCIFEATESNEIKKEITAALSSLREELKPLQQFSFFGNLALYSGDVNSVVQGQNTVSTRPQTTPESQLRKALLSFKRITELRAENPSLNMAMFDAIIRELSCLLFNYELFNECIEVLEIARPALNTAKGISNELFAFNRLIISCYLKLGDSDKVKEWVGILKQDLVRAYGTWEILREVSKPFLAQFDKFQGGLEFFNL